MKSKINNRAYYIKRFRFIYLIIALFVLFNIRGAYTLIVYLQNDILHTPTLVSKIIGFLEWPIYSSILYYFFLSNRDSKIIISVDDRIINIVFGSDKTAINVDYEIDFDKSTFKNGLLTIYKKNHTTHYIVPNSILEISVRDYVQENIVNKIIATKPQK